MEAPGQAGSGRPGGACVCCWSTELVNVLCLQCLTPPSLQAYRAFLDEQASAAGVGSVDAFKAALQGRGRSAEAGSSDAASPSGLLLPQQAVAPSRPGPHLIQELDAQAPHPSQGTTAPVAHTLTSEPPRAGDEWRFGALVFETLLPDVSSVKELDVEAREVSNVCPLAFPQQSLSRVCH